MPNYKKKKMPIPVIHFIGGKPKKRTRFFGGNKVLGNSYGLLVAKVKIGSSLDSYIIGYCSGK